MNTYPKFQLPALIVLDVLLGLAYITLPMDATLVRLIIGYLQLLAIVYTFICAIGSFLREF